MINPHGEYMAIPLDDDPPLDMEYVESASFSGGTRRIYTTPRPRPIQARREAKHLGAGVYEIEGTVTRDQGLADAVAREYDNRWPHPIRYPVKFVGGPRGGQMLHIQNPPEIGARLCVPGFFTIGEVREGAFPDGVVKALHYRCEGWTAEHYVFTFEGER